MDGRAALDRLLHQHDERIRVESTASQKEFPRRPGKTRADPDIQRPRCGGPPRIDVRRLHPIPRHRSMSPVP